MEEKKELQNRLLRYFKFGNNDEEAKAKLKCLALDFEFFDLKLGDNVDKINEHIAEFNSLILLSDMHVMRQIRESITFIKEKNEENPSGVKIDKNQFQEQYLAHLDKSSISRAESIAQLKRIGGNMKDLGCPIGEHLEGVVFGSRQFQTLYTLSMTGLIDKVLQNINVIKGA